MPIENWFAFVVASTFLLMMPGPTILTVISYSMAHGKRANIALVVAVVLGDTTALFVSLIGLGSILSASAFWFTVVKVLGGIYLLYLGLKLIFASNSATEIVTSIEAGSRLKLFVNTYLVTALNPKGIVFFIAFLPQFISHDLNVNHQLWMLASTFVFLAGLNAAFYTIFATSVRNLLSSYTAQRKFNILGGTLLSAAGIWSLLSRRPA